MEKQIVKVYSGKNHACMCGCAGKWSYTAYGAREHSPGYNVDDSVNERGVKMIAKKVLSASNKEVDGNCVFAVEGLRLRAVYYE
jgi:hypothetical protein